MHCDGCRGANLREVGIGTEAVEKKLRELFPKKTIQRLDTDLANHREKSREIFENLQNKKIDILVGTQIVAKGLDLPGVTFVGVVLADIGLAVPDFRASERVFALLTQVAGRAGRGSAPGEVVVQTFAPEHPAIRFGVQRDLRGFFAGEVSERKKFLLPPFAQILRLNFSARGKAAAYDLAWNFRKRLVRKKSKTKILGPAPGWPVRRGDFYRFELELRGDDPARILDGEDLSGFRVEWR